MTPKEEPKQILGVDFEFSIDDEGMSVEIPIIKKETLEEARANSYIDFAKSNEDVSAYSFVAGWNKGAKWQQERSQSIVPFDAYNIEVFKIEANENGLFAYIGYKISNGNFNFNVVPFTEPKQERNYSEEDMKSFGDWCRNGLLNTEYSVDRLDKHLEQWKQFKKK